MARSVRRRHRPDVVTLRVVGSGDDRTITGVSVIGSAAPCANVLYVGQSLNRASQALTENGFTLICTKTYVRVFRRYHCRRRRRSIR